MFFIQWGRNNTWNKIKYLLLNISTIFSSKMLYLWWGVKALGPAGDRGRPVEPDVGQMEWAKCPIRSFNDSWAGATCHCEQGGGRKMSQFVSKWLCNSRVLSSRDKGHPHNSWEGNQDLQEAGTEAVPSSATPTSPWDLSSINTQQDRSLGATDFPWLLLIAFLDEWRLFDQN